LKARKIKAVSKKEFKQLIRDRRLLFVIFFFPVLLLVVFGYAINFDVQHVKIAVLDKDKTPESRLLLDKLSATVYFDLVRTLSSYKEIDDVIDSKEAQVVMVIPHDFSKKINTPTKDAKLQFIIDGIDGNTATIIKSYVDNFTLLYSQKLNADFLNKLGREITPAITVAPLFEFNPDLRSTVFLLPGLIAMILIVTAAVTVALSFVREKEHGTEEQLRVSSLSSIELIIGKSLPYILVAIINATIVLVAGSFLFDVAIKGSLLLLAVAVVIFVIAATALGILVSVLSDSQQVAFQLASLISLLPSLILSGFIFPIESMPDAIKIFTNLTPATFFIKAIRAIMLKGVGLQYFWPQLIYLALFPIILFALASLITKRKLDKA